MLKEMLSHVPLYERKNEIFIEIFNAETNQLELLKTDIDDIRKQMIVDTATWGLAIYEKELKIPVSPDVSLDERRARIKAKWRSGGKVDRALLEAVASAILQTIVKVEFDGKVIFSFEPGEREIKNFGSFHRAIGEVKPAHLPMELQARIKETILLNYRGYDFPVEYRITNTFHTADVGGGLGKAPIELQEKAYAVDVLYPITNTFNTSAITVEDEQINVMLTEEYRNNDILYKRVGDTHAGEGVI